MLLTERLMVLFADRLDGNYSVGEALKWAKNDYFAERGIMSVYDEKSLQQAVLYGLPFGRPDVATPPPRPAPPTNTTTSVDPTSGLETATFALDFAFDEVTDPVRGTVWELDGKSFATSNNPLQPIATVDVTSTDVDGDGQPDARLHGSVLRSGSGRLISGVDPVYQRATIDSSANEPEPTPVGAIFPTSPLSFSSSDTEYGPRDTLVVIPGRFRATEANGNGVQTLFDEMAVQSYYSNSTDWTPPSVKQVQTLVTGLPAPSTQRSLVVTTDTSDDVGVAAVVAVLVEDPTPGQPATWRSFDLTPSGSGRWSGATLISVCAARVELFIQVVDTSGNVGVMTNKAENFAGNCDVLPPVQPPEIQAAPTSPPDTSGWYSTSPITIEVTSTISPLFYEIDNGGRQLLVGSSFPISGDGVHTYAVTNGDGDLVAPGSVSIDTNSAPPEADIVSPAGDATYVSGSTTPIVFSCSDPSLASCVGALDPGGVVVSGDGLPEDPGTYVLTVTATDAFGNMGTAQSTFTIEAAGSSPPDGLAIETLQTPQLISDGVSVDITFDDPDGADDYTVTVDWGDADEDVPGDTSTVCVATSTAPTVGTAPGEPSCAVVAQPGAAPGAATADFVYPRPGVYAITVTVTDSDGELRHRGVRIRRGVRPRRRASQRVGLVLLGPRGVRGRRPVRQLRHLRVPRSLQERRDGPPWQNQADASSAVRLQVDQLRLLDHQRHDGDRRRCRQGRRRRRVSVPGAGHRQRLARLLPDHHLGTGWRGVVRQRRPVRGRRSGAARRDPDQTELTEHRSAVGLLLLVGLCSIVGACSGSGTDVQPVVPDPTTASVGTAPDGPDVGDDALVGPGCRHGGHRCRRATTRDSRADDAVGAGADRHCRWPVDRSAG